MPGCDSSACSHCTLFQIEAGKAHLDAFGAVVFLAGRRAEASMRRDRDRRSASLLTRLNRERFFAGAAAFDWDRRA